MKLDIGAGKYKRQGYEGVDMVEGADHNFDVSKPWPFDAESVEDVYTSHFLEHVSNKTVLNVLKESYRVLQDGGKIEVNVPNLPEVCRLFIDGPPEYRWGFGIMTIFGQGDVDGQFHVNGFDNDKLIYFLEHAGFADVSCEEIWSHSQPCLLARGVKRAKTV